MTHMNIEKYNTQGEDSRQERLVLVTCDSVPLQAISASS